MTAAPPPYRTRVLTTLAEFEAFEPEWTAFIPELGDPRVQYDYPWIHQWLQHFPVDSLYVVLIYDASDRLTAIAPLKISRPTRGLFRRCLRHLQFIGTEPTAYEEMSILIRQNVPRKPVLEALCQTLLERRTTWDVLDLQFSFHPEDFRLMAERLHNVSAHARVQSNVKAYYIDLTGALPQKRAFQKKNYLHKLRQSMKSLARDFPDEQLRLVFCRPSPETEAHFARFVQNHQTYWAKRGGKSDFTRFPALKSFYQGVLEASAKKERLTGSVEFSLLMLGDRVFSYHVNLIQPTCMTAHISSYQEDFSKYSPGMLHCELLLDFAIAHQLEFVDMGRGDETYKKRWIIPERFQELPLYDIQVFQSHWARGLHAIDHGLSQLLLAVRKRSHSLP